jgi:hypothetical protein
MIAAVIALPITALTWLADEHSASDGKISLSKNQKAKLTIGGIGVAVVLIAMQISSWSSSGVPRQHELSQTGLSKSTIADDAPEQKALPDKNAAREAEVEALKFGPIQGENLRDAADIRARYAYCAGYLAGFKIASQAADVLQGMQMSLDNVVKKLLLLTANHTVGGQDSVPVEWSDAINSARSQAILDFKSFQSSGKSLGESQTGLEVPRCAKLAMDAFVPH